MPGATSALRARRNGRDLGRNAHLSCTLTANPHDAPWLDEIAWEHELLLLPLSSFIALDGGVFCNFVIMETASQSPLYVP
jgi:hypothetical protein